MQLRYVYLVCLILAAAFAQFDDNSGPVKPPKLRGIDKMGAGIDLVTLELKMSPIDLTWQGKWFTNPYDDKDYEIPWEIDSLSTPDTFTNQTTNVRIY